jgi:SRSO17 transposase
VTLKSEHDAIWLQRLDDFADQFREDFRRRDQARWAAVYLQGLLLPPGERKTIGTMARRVILPADLVVEDVAQAMQNFVNQSPWDERLAVRRIRARLAETFADPEGAFVVDELAVPKQGRHSVGVQRQYSSALGRKTNCQVAVCLHHFGSAGVCPLGMRLYLPKSWLNSPTQLDAAGVPEEVRKPQSKAAISLELLDEARSEGWMGRIVVAGNGYGADRDFRAALDERGFTYVAEADLDQPVGPAEHLKRPVGDEVTLLSNRAFDDGMLRAWRGKAAAREVGRSLLQDFGLEHFEGRSWRGFHHHACLVLMAFAFSALCGKSGCCAAVG